MRYETLEREKVAIVREYPHPNSARNAGQCVQPHYVVDVKM